MFSLLFHLTLTLISRPLGAYTASAPDGGLLDSCNTSTIIFTAVNGPVTLEDPYYTTTPVLSGECLTKGGEYTNSSLDLNACLENINDSLAWQENGYFLYSCSPCYLQFPQFCCECAQAEGDIYDLPDVCINLEEGIYDVDGRLACNGTIGNLTATIP